MGVNVGVGETTLPHTTYTSLLRQWAYSDVTVSSVPSCRLHKRTTASALAFMVATSRRDRAAWDCAASPAAAAAV